MSISPFTAKEVAKVLRKNKEERHIRGGNATKMKYKNT
jgi:putative DeoR family transcriptional regulator (stage III sporulation protein D)